MIFRRGEEKRFFPGVKEGWVRSAPASPLPNQLDKLNRACEEPKQTLS